MGLLPVGQLKEDLPLLTKLGTSKTVRTRTRSWLDSRPGFLVNVLKTVPFAPFSL